MNPNRPDKFDLPWLLALVRRRWWLIVLPIALAGGAALALSLVATPQYSAEASLLFRDPGFDQRLFGSSVFQTTDPTRQAATNLELVELDIVAKRAAAELGSSLTRDEIRSKVEVSTESDSDVISIVATDPDPDRAAEIANAFAESYIDFRRDADRAKIGGAQRLVESNLRTLEEDPESSSEKEIESLQDQVSQLKTLKALQTGNAELVQRATAPENPSSPKPIRNTLFGGLLGVLLGVAGVLLIERFDRRLRTPNDLADAYGLTLLGEISKSNEFASHDPDADQSMAFLEREEFRMLRTRLRYFNVDRRLDTVLVTSASPGEGKSTIAWNLAQAAADAGGRTLLIECDFHRPTVAARHGLSPIPGLAELLTHQVARDTVSQAVGAPEGAGTTDSGPLHVISAGATPPNPGALLESAEMSSFLALVAEEYDLVVLDTPPIGVLADVIPLLELVSGILVVGRCGATSRDDAERLSKQLENTKGQTLGIVANYAPVHEFSYRGYYRPDKEMVPR